MTTMTTRGSNSRPTNTETEFPADRVIVEKHMIVQTPPQIPIFNGDHHVTLNEYTTKLKAAWRKYAVSHEDKLDLMHNSLGPNVAAELRLYPEKSGDPEALLSVIVDIFGEEKTLAQLMSIFLSTSQTSRESVRAFSIRLHETFLNLTEAQSRAGLNPTEQSMLLDQFVSSLRSTTVRSTVRAKYYENKAVSFRELRDFAIMLSEEDSSNKPFVASHHVHVENNVDAGGSNSETDGLHQTLYDLKNEVIALKNKMEKIERPMGEHRLLGTMEQPNRSRFEPRPIARQASRRQIICHRCNRVGHIARNCHLN